jgi:ssDNA-binding Zn-finger/Zn-ribbon topoisomerase 1
MLLKKSRYGQFYGCSRWPDCACTHGAHPDGSPKGIPGDKATREARIAAHEAFDRLWKPRGEPGKMPRSEAYRILREMMDMTAGEAHIARFTKEQCKKLIDLLSACPLSPKGQS